MDVLTDDHEREQVVRQWWSEYWKPIVLGIVIALAGLLGYRYFQQHQLEQAQQQAYAMYQLETKLSLNDSASITDAEAFIKDHKDIYGSLLALDLSAIYATKGDFEAAIKTANFAKQHGGDLVVPVATIAEARLQAQTKDFDGALKTLESVKSEAYAITRYEAQGDILLQKGDKNGAHDAFKKAIDLSVETKTAITPLLQMKFDSVIKAGDTPAYKTAEAGRQLAE